jgi:hypothetical protein
MLKKHICLDISKVFKNIKTVGEYRDLMNVLVDEYGAETNLDILNDGDSYFADHFFDFPEWQTDGEDGELLPVNFVIRKIKDK